MAGTAIISSKVAWTVGLRFFDPIIDRIRENFPQDEPSLLDEIFSSTFDNGLDIVSIENCKKDEFIKFHDIAKRQYAIFSNDETLRRSSILFNGILECWLDLIQLLEEDPRFQES